MEKKKDTKLLKIYKYGDEILKQMAADVTNIDGQLMDFIENMVRTLYASRSAIGLAAPQVGKSLRITAIDLTQGQEEGQLIVLINPKIIEMEGKDTLEEGCLSFPGISVPVNRATRILLETVTPEGKEIRQEVEGYLARVMQHEIDHLDGTLIIDRVSSLRRQVMKREIRKLQDEGEW